MTTEQLEAENARLRDQLNRLRALAPKPEDLGAEALRSRQIEAMRRAVAVAEALR